MSNASDFVIEDGVLVKYNGHDEEVVVPDSVVEIGSSVFLEYEELKKIILPSGLKRIGFRAFERTGLVEVTFPGSMVEIGGWTFYECEKLKEIILPDGIQIIGSRAFECTSLETVTIPKSLVEISQSTFMDCKNLKTITFAEGLRRIDDRAFEHTGLESVVFPETLVEIGKAAFCRCNNLKNVTFPDNLSKIGRKAFGDTGIESVELPDSLDELSAWTFAQTNIKNIDFLGKVKTIGSSAFCGCDKLETVVIPKNVECIETSVFEQCNNLKNLTISIDKFDSSIIGQGNMATLLNLLQEGKETIHVIAVGREGWDKNSSPKYKPSVILPLSLEAIPIYDKLVASGKNDGFKMKKSDRVHAALLRLNDKGFPVSDELRPLFVELLESCINDAIKYAEEDTSPQYIQSLIDIGAINSGNQSKVVKRLQKSSVQEIKILVDQLSQSKLPESPVDKDAPPPSILRRMETIKADELLKSYGIVSFPVVILADGSGPARVEYLKYILAEYVYNYDKKKLDIIDKADKAAELLDKKSLQSALLTIYSDLEDIYKQMAVLPALFRYADGETIRRIYPARATHHYWNDWHSRRDPASSALMLSDTIEAVQYLDKYGLLEDYSDFRFIDEDYLKDQIRSLPEVEDIIQSTYDFEKHCFVDADNGTEVRPISAETLKKYLEEAKEEVKPFTDEGLPDVLLADKTGPAPKEYFAFILSEYSLNCDCESPRFIRRAEEVAKLLDKQSLADAVDALYRDYVKTRKFGVFNYKTWAVIFRFASGSVVKDFNSLIKYEDEDENLLLSDTREAMIIAEKRDLLWKYAFIRGTNEEKLRDSIMAEFGLDEDGVKIYDLGSGKITVRLNSELKLELYDEKAGKTVKSIPKRNADPEKYEKAKQDYDDLRKNIKNVAKNRTNLLFKAFLEGSEYSVSEWKELYLKNPVLNRVGRLIVWSQNKETFTLSENGPIDYSGKRYELSDIPIVVAHPMEMNNFEVVGWQHYFVSNGVKQPFQQIWEPVYDLNAIESNRYDGCKIPLYRFYKQEKHGIECSGYYIYDNVHIYFKDCGASVKCIEGGDNLNALYGVENIRISRPSRKANHIVSYLDRITVIPRIRSDDTSVMQVINDFTLAQIMEFIAAAQEAKASNVLAALMEYKNNNYPDFDPMSEFTLDI